MLEIKNTVTEMSRVSAGLISRGDAAKKISVSLDMSTDKSQNKKKKKNEKREQNIQYYGTIIKGVTYV